MEDDLGMTNKLFRDKSILSMTPGVSWNFQMSLLALLTDHAHLNFLLTYFYQYSFTKICHRIEEIFNSNCDIYLTLKYIHLFERKINYFSN